jgi:uncharacterized coiled-coil protein SlyX
VIDPAVIGPLIGGLLAVTGAGIGVYVGQRNRRRDRTDSRYSRDATAGVADSRVALDAYISINATTLSLVASLTARLDGMQKRVDDYENKIVPALEATIAEQKATIADLLAQVTAQKENIAVLVERIDKLERELQHKESP